MTQGEDLPEDLHSALELLRVPVFTGESNATEFETTAHHEMCLQCMSRTVSRALCWAPLSPAPTTTPMCQ